MHKYRNLSAIAAENCQYDRNGAGGEENNSGANASTI
jgi:hypothetical protein